MSETVIPMESTPTTKPLVWANRELVVAGQISVTISQRQTNPFFSIIRLPLWHSTGTHQHRTVLPIQLCFRQRQDGRTNIAELYKILREEQVECPVKGHTDLLFKSRQFRQVNRPPQPPGNEP